MKNSGNFIDFYLPYQTPGQQEISPTAQAKAILDNTKSILDQNECPGVAITCSANYSQTKAIEQTYLNGNWNPDLSGTDQGAVMSEMISLMESSYPELQGKVEIAPITTANIGGHAYGNATQKQIVEKDLERIESKLEQGWTVLGWKNDESGDYAIGSYEAKKTGHFPEELSEMVQTKLKNLSSEYSPEK